MVKFATANNYQHRKSFRRFAYVTILTLFFILFIGNKFAFTQNVGIGTNQPKARLHITDSSVVFTGAYSLWPDINPPVSGTGIRFMWYPGRAALRAGTAFANEWDKDSIGIGSMALGEGTMAKGLGSVALGSTTRAIGNFSFAMGSDSKSLGDGSISMGVSNIASAEHSVSIGFLNSATNRGSVAIGTMDSAIGFLSLAAGSFNKAIGTYSTSIGRGIVSKAYGSVALGFYNDTSDMPIPSLVDPSDRIFQIGNGYGETRSNALTILRNGNTGIGTLTPQAFLHLKGNSYPTPTLILEENENDFARMQFRNTTVGRFWEIGAKPSTTNSSASFEIWHAGGLNNIFTIRGDGNATLLGSLTQASDIRLKKEINKLSPVLEKIDQLNAYSYFWKDNNMDQQQQIGLLAQEVETVFPTLVKTDDKGIKSVNYISLIPVLLSALKELQEEVKSLKEMIK